MKLLFISYSFKKGGAAIAALRFSSILDGQATISTISQDGSGKLQFLKRLISYVLSKFQFDKNPIKHSLNLFSFDPVIDAIKKNEGFLFHIHWFNNDTLSVFDFDKIPSRSIITLHDEWLYCGAEHYYNLSDNNLDFINGYRFFKKGVWGVNWNYIIWLIKYKKLKHRSDLIFTVPSNWLLSRAKRSLMLSNSDVRLLPNPIDINKFSPESYVNVLEYRSLLNISPENIVFLFGEFIGANNFHKGVHLFEQALAILSHELPDDLRQKIRLISFGNKSGKPTMLHGFIKIPLGHLSKPSQLALLYSSVDCVIVPSMVESFGQVAAEALACETPVISFDCSGLADIVINGQTGLTATSFSIRSLADKLKEFILLDHAEKEKLGRRGRVHVMKNFSYPVIEKLYKEIINNALLLKKDG